MAALFLTLSFIALFVEFQLIILINLVYESLMKKSTGGFFDSMYYDHRVPDT